MHINNIGMLIKITRYRGPQEKRFTAEFENGKRISFGQKNPRIGTYYDHGDDMIKEAYISRHKINEDWTNPYTAGTLSRYILWNRKYETIEDAIDDYNDKFFN